MTHTAQVEVHLHNSGAPMARITLGIRDTGWFFLGQEAPIDPATLVALCWTVNPGLQAIIHSTPGGEHLDFLTENGMTDMTAVRLAASAMDATEKGSQ